MHANVEQNQSISTRDIFKGRCSLCVDFDFKGHVTNYQQCLTSYLHAKLEQSWLINTRDTLQRSLWPLFGLFASKAMNQTAISDQLKAMVQTTNSGGQLDADL